MLAVDREQKTAELYLQMAVVTARELASSWPNNPCEE